MVTPAVASVAAPIYGGYHHGGYGYGAVSKVVSPVSYATPAYGSYKRSICIHYAFKTRVYQLVSVLRNLIPIKNENPARNRLMPQPTL